LPSETIGGHQSSIRGLSSSPRGEACESFGRANPFPPPGSIFPPNEKNRIQAKDIAKDPTGRNPPPQLSQASPPRGVSWFGNSLSF
jgi:hypothetical protein